MQHKSKTCVEQRKKMNMKIRYTTTSRINPTSGVCLGNSFHTSNLISQAKEMATIRFYLFFLTIVVFLTACHKEQLPGVSPYSPEKELFEMSFLKANNVNLDKDYLALVEGQNVTISVPKGTNISKLVPTFKLSDKASLKVSGVKIENGKTAIDFNGTLTFDVIAQNETIAKYYPSVVLVGLNANLKIKELTSYNNYIKDNLYIDQSIAMSATPLNQAYTAHSYEARAYGDFDKDGDLDIVSSFTNPSTNVASEVEFYKNNGFQLIKDQSVFTGGTPKIVSGSKAITGDFDGNGWLDVVISSTGFNGNPYPGESITVLLNTNGKFTSKNLDLPKGYFGSVTAGDIDNDGDLDLFITDNKTTNKFLVNDGKANFKVESDLFPNSFYNKSYFTSELYDINADGYLDIVMAGFEHVGASTVVLWGNATGNYTTSRMTTLPRIAGKGNVVDIDFLDYDKDGKMDVLLTRKSDGSATEGYYLQLLKSNGTDFTDVTAIAIPQNTDADDTNWIKWIRIQDIDNDGDADITTDDRFYSKVWVNNNGKFEQK